MLCINCLITSLLFFFSKLILNSFELWINITKLRNNHSQNNNNSSFQHTPSSRLSTSSNSSRIARVLSHSFYRNLRASKKAKQNNSFKVSFRSVWNIYAAVISAITERAHPAFHWTSLLYYYQVINLISCLNSWCSLLTLCSSNMKRKTAKDIEESEQ